MQKNCYHACLKAKHSLNKNLLPLFVFIKYIEMHEIHLVIFLTVLHYFLVSSQKICKEPRKYKSAPLVERGSTRVLERVTIMCTAPGIVFEVRYSNGSLCACGHLKKANRRDSFMCNVSLSKFDVVVNASINRIRSGYKERCDVSLHFYPASETDFSQRRISIIRPLPSETKPTRDRDVANIQPSYRSSTSSEFPSERGVSATFQHKVETNYFVGTPKLLRSVSLCLY